MRSEAPALLPILRSRHLAEILTVLLLHPDVEYTLSELAATIGLPLTTVQREVTRLSNAQLIQERRVGRSRLVSADLSSRYARPLTELVTLAFGPHFVIGEEFGSLGAVAVAIYGSWAARYEGVEGHPVYPQIEEYSSICENSAGRQPPPSVTSTRTSSGVESSWTTSPGAAAASDPNVPSGRPARPAGERRPGDVPPVGQRAE